MAIYLFETREQESYSPGPTETCIGPYRSLASAARAIKQTADRPTLSAYDCNGTYLLRKFAAAGTGKFAIA